MIIISAKYYAISIIALLFVLLTGNINADDFKTLPFSLKDVSFSDSTNNKIISGIVKINPVQIIFCEIPVSLEIFLKKSYSLQFQVGYIFPRYDALLQQFMEHQGWNGDATYEGFCSFRTSPFNNYGISTKAELRKYGKSLYYSFQLMYKYCYYNELTYILSKGTAVYQTESKDSNIGGIGFILGQQSKKRRIIFDKYLCVGMRSRSVNTVINKIEPYFNQTAPWYPNRSENTTSFYPFVNCGLRIGLKFGGD